MTPEFDGAKIAILRGPDVLTLQRDDDPSIAYPGLWDLPGGAREAGETPLGTVSRELFEELNIVLEPSRIVYQVKEKGHLKPHMPVFFFVAEWGDLQDCTIRLGNEGQGWMWMPTSDFVVRDDVVPILRGRLLKYLEGRDTEGTFS